MQQLTSRDFVNEVVKRYKGQGHKNHELTKIASLWNGFEGWLKTDLALMLMESHSRVSWSERGEWGTVGVEFKARLEPSKSPPFEPGRKQVDLWFCSKLTQKPLTYYDIFVELKIAFNNYNAKKQIQGWVHDIECLARIDRDQRREGIDENWVADGGIAILFGVGFTEDTPFRAAVKKELPQRRQDAVRFERLADKQPDVSGYSLPSVEIATLMVDPASTDE